jgi:kynureninase
MDYKRPNVFRISPHMLYNTFHELFLLVDFLRKRTFEHLSKMAPAYREGMETG